MDKKTAELLSQIADGEQKYIEDVYFRNCVDALIMGVEPIKLIDLMCKQKNEMTRIITEEIPSKIKKTLYQK